MSAMSPATVREQSVEIDNIHSAWPETRNFLREVKRQILPMHGALAFANVGRVVEEIGERYG
jgi:hypothetical protein